MSTERVDVVVVGSGFGGSVSAYRHAEAGRRVVVFERGRAYPPGTFPRTPTGLSANFWEPEEGHHGLFDVWSFKGINGVVSSGLGGGSLIYANVLLRKDEKWFVQEQPLPGGGYEHWPVSRADLDPHYDAVEEMLGATRYPYPDTAMTNVMEESAARLGLEIQRPPLAVSFTRRPGGEPVKMGEIETPAYGNIHGVPRATCRLCGECDLGCNFGAKNSLDHTYLSAAQHHGADIRVRHEVVGFRPIERGYEVRYVVHQAGRGEPSVDLPVHTIEADRLVLAAGTFGTNRLLLRNRTALPGISPMLGRRFSGNGDLLGLVVRTGRKLRSHEGPVITTAIRVPDATDGAGVTDRGFYVQDAGYPAWGMWMLELIQAAGTAGRLTKFVVDRATDGIGQRDTTIGANLAELLGAGDFSSTSMPLLGMGRDIPDGQFKLRGGELDLDWRTTTSRPFFEHMRSVMRSVAEDLGGQYSDTPLWWFDKVITVHPLGGAPMGRHVDEGVCDEHGEVFGYPGLQVVDGALMPGPVGANPSLTIAALADRAATHVLGNTPATSGSGSGPSSTAFVPPPQSTAVAPPARAEGRSGVEFTEKMRGALAWGATDFEEGYARGESAMFKLTISIDDMDRFTADPDHLGSAAGYVDADFLGGRFQVDQGWFNLFSPADSPQARRMLYRLWFTGPGGNPLTLTGFKHVEDDKGFDTWRDTSTLYTKVLAGHVPPGGDDGQVLAAGILRIRMLDFAMQLTTFRAWGEHPVRALRTFGQLFLGELFLVYGKQLVRNRKRGRTK
jgi:cholesterol oxidase